MAFIIPHTLLVMGHQFKKLGPGSLKKALLTQWKDYRRRQYILAKSYRSHHMARGLPSRTWMRHSALLTLMDEQQRNMH